MLHNLTLEAHGAERLDRAALALLPDLRALADTVPRAPAGTRLHAVPALTALLPALTDIAAAHLATARPVRAILFDKTAESNRALCWHQDRVIAVRERIDTPGYGSWSVKRGMVHVAPPEALLAGMLTMRVHLDAVSADNAPLLIAPGSHRLGRIAEARIESVVRDCGNVTCLAEAGDVWLYATPIVHMSDVAARPARRRVLQIDFAAPALPNGLDWLGV